MLSFPLRSASLQWFLCLYVNYLSPRTVLRVWDLFFLWGPAALFRVALSLLRYLASDIIKVDGLRQKLLRDPGRTEDDVDSDLDQRLFDVLREGPLQVKRGVRG